MALWRNGRRAGLRNQFLREYRFKSDKGYKSGFLCNVLPGSTDKLKKGYCFAGVMEWYT
jgi:hypothetical protein